METRRLHDFVPEIKDNYFINTDGEIFSDRVGKMKSRNKPGTEYQIINFQTVDNKKKTFRVHRLVLMAFAPVDGMENLQVNHIDGNKKNNKLSNLEWCTSSENQKHAYATGLNRGRKGESSHLSKLTNEDIEKIFELHAQGYLQREIAEIVGCTRSNISYILNNKTWQA